MYKNEYFYNRAKLYISIHVYKTITFYRHPLQEINIDSERKRPWRRECFFASACHFIFWGTENQSYLRYFSHFP